MILHTAGGVCFQIDEDDYEAVSYFSWWACDGYIRTFSRGRPDRKSLKLHQFIGGKPSRGLLWDHINRDKLDNRRANLRLVTPTVNMRNRAVQTNSRSGLRGIHKHTGKWFTRPWEAYITVDNQRVYLGVFATKEEAILARQSGEMKYWKVEA